MCTNGIPVEIQTPAHLNVMTVLPPVLSPNSILLSPSTHCYLILERKILARFLSDSPSCTKLHMLGCVCNLDELQTSPWLRWFIPSLLPREPGFDPGSTRVWFVVGRVAGDQVLLPVMRLSPVSIAPHCCVRIFIFVPYLSEGQTFGTFEWRNAIQDIRDRYKVKYTKLYRLPSAISGRSGSPKYENIRTKYKRVAREDNNKSGTDKWMGGILAPYRK